MTAEAIPDPVGVYQVHPAPADLPVVPDWDHPGWTCAMTVSLTNFHSRSSDHRPRVQARLLYDAAHLYLQFRVEDRYVRVVSTRFMEPVCRDSCVEFFVRPQSGRGYFNFEINAGGTLLASHVVDWRRDEKGLADRRPLAPEAAEHIRIVTTLTAPIDPEIVEPTIWLVAARIPYEVFEPYIEPVHPAPGDEWRANFYKCADNTSHPHWASWNPIGERLNFHCPDHFGRLSFV